MDGLQSHPQTQGRQAIWGLQLSEAQPSRMVALGRHWGFQNLPGASRDSPASLWASLAGAPWCHLSCEHWSHDRNLQSLVWDKAGDRQWGDRQVPPGPAGVAQAALTSVSQPRPSCCHHDAVPSGVAAPQPAPQGRAELLRMEPSLGKGGRE